MKGEEYKTEDLLKDQSKLNLSIYSKLANKDKSLVMVYSNMEQAAGYLKIMRPDKVLKFYMECVD